MAARLDLVLGGERRDVLLGEVPPRRQEYLKLESVGIEGDRARQRFLQRHIIATQQLAHKAPVLSVAIDASRVSGRSRVNVVALLPTGVCSWLPPQAPRATTRGSQELTQTSLFRLVKKSL